MEGAYAKWTGGDPAVRRCDNQPSLPTQPLAGRSVVVPGQQRMEYGTASVAVREGG